MGALLFATLGAILFGTFVGWLVHWTLHQPWMGKLYRSHLTHHRNYPPRDMTSGEYRKAGKDDSFFLFLPFIGLAMAAYCGTMALLQLPWWTQPLTMGLSVLIGWLHDYVHEAFHLRATKLDRFPWFQRLRELHLTHHRDVRRNLGILWFGWDRVFRTFKR